MYPNSTLFAGIKVSDFKAAVPWYEQLLGAPAFQPHETEMVWEVGQGSFIYINESPGAGSSMVTLFLDDLDAAAREISGRGLEPAESETYSNGVRKLTYRDPDGNEIGFGGAPSEAEA